MFRYFEYLIRLIYNLLFITLILIGLICFVVFVIPYTALINRLFQWKRKDPPFYIYADQDILDELQVNLEIKTSNQQKNPNPSWPYIEEEAMATIFYKGEHLTFRTENTLAYRLYFCYQQEKICFLEIFNSFYNNPKKQNEIYVTKTVNGLNIYYFGEIKTSDVDCEKYEDNFTYQQAIEETYFKIHANLHSSITKNFLNYAKNNSWDKATQDEQHAKFFEFYDPKIAAPKRTIFDDGLPKCDHPRR